MYTNTQYYTYTCSCIYRYIHLDPVQHSSESLQFVDNLTYSNDFIDEKRKGSLLAVPPSTDNVYESLDSHPSKRSQNRAYYNN